MNYKLLSVLATCILTACASGGGGDGGGSQPAAPTVTYVSVPNPEFVKELEKRGHIVSVSTDGKIRLDELVEGELIGTLRVKTSDGVREINLSKNEGRSLNIAGPRSVAANHTLPKSASIYVFDGVTPEKQVPVKGKATYEGTAAALSVSEFTYSTYSPSLTQAYSVEYGKANLVADFEAKKLNGSLTFEQTSSQKIAVPVEAMIQGNRFASLEGKPTTVQGSFYGTKADSVAGVFDNAELNKRGLFVANSVDVQKLAPIPETVLQAVTNSYSGGGSGSSGHSSSGSSGSSSGAGHSAGNSHYESKCIGGRTWVDGYRKRNGTYVSGHWRRC